MHRTVCGKNSFKQLFSCSDSGPSTRTSMEIVYNSVPSKILLMLSPFNPNVDSVLEELVAMLRELLPSSEVIYDKSIMSEIPETDKLWGEVQELYKGQVVTHFGDAVRVDKLIEENLEEVDLVITVGGDGTMLRVNKVFPDVIPPVIGLSMGSLGYLAKFNLEKVRETIANIVTEGFKISLRAQLQVTVNDETGKALIVRNALNECVVDRGGRPRTRRPLALHHDARRVLQRGLLHDRLRRRAHAHHAERLYRVLDVGRRVDRAPAGRLAQRAGRVDALHRDLPALDIVPAAGAAQVVGHKDRRAAGQPRVRPGLARRPLLVQHPARLLGHHQDLEHELPAGAAAAHHDHQGVVRLAQGKPALERADPAAEAARARARQVVRQHPQGRQPLMCTQLYPGVEQRHRVAGHRGAAAERVEPLVGLGLDVHERVVAEQQVQVFPDRLLERAYPGRLEYDTDVDVDEREGEARHHLEHVVEHVHRRQVREARVGVGEVVADVALAERAQDRVADRVEHHVAVAVREHADGAVGDVDAAELQRLAAGLGRHDPVDVVPVAYPGARRAHGRKGVDVRAEQGDVLLALELGRGPGLEGFREFRIEDTKNKKLKHVCRRRASLNLAWPWNLALWCVSHTSQFGPSSGGRFLALVPPYFKLPVIGRPGPGYTPQSQMYHTHGAQ